MPRGVPRVPKTDKQKENAVKASIGVSAQHMLDIVDELKAKIEKDIFKMLLTHPASDIENIQRKYVACQEVCNYLLSKIAEGKIAKDKLQKEEE